MSINKIVASGLITVGLFSASVASAQSYYPSYGYTSGSCVSITSDLSYGSKNPQVTQLQTFLVAQNYSGSGSWMVTGYFGQATAAAVRIFQQTHGLPQSGAVDASTRAAINSASCGGQNYLPGLGGTGYTNQYLPTGQAGNYNQYPYNNYTNYNNYSNSYPYSYTAPYNYNYNNNYNGNYGGFGCGTYPYFSCSTYGTTPQITSLSTTVASPGSSVTVYGTGFDQVNNTVYVGGTTLSNIASVNGVMLTFTMPSNSNTSSATSVSVANSHGTSNALTLNTGSYGYPYNNYPPINQYPCIPGQGGYGYSYGYNNCPPNTGVPTVLYLSPNSGGVGTSVTVFGSGFSTTNNTVHFGNGIISNLSSNDGRSVSFTVPSTLAGYGYQPIGLGTYNVSVSNSSGVTSNTMPFTITSLGTTGAITISNVSGPTSLGVGVSGTWSVTIQNPNSSYVTTSVTWGDTGNGYVNQAAPIQTYAQGATTLTFTHAYFANGTYTITFTASNGSGQSTISSATVYVSGSGTTGTISITSLSPISGPIGTQMTIHGTGFDALNNTVHFGNGGTMHVPSTNGVIYYTIPSYISPCDVSGGGICAQYLQQVTPASYPVYVTSPNGSSNTLNFQVL